MASASRKDADGRKLHHVAQCSVAALRSGRATVWRRAKSADVHGRERVRAAPERATRPASPWRWATSRTPPTTASPGHQQPAPAAGAADPDGEGDGDGDGIASSCVREHAAAPRERRLPVAGVVERRQGHAVAGAGRVDEPAIAQVQPGVVDRLDARLGALGPEEDEVAALELRAGDARLGAGGHVVGPALVHGDRIPEVHLHDVEDEARAVEPAGLLRAVGRVRSRVLARPDVGVTDPFEREPGDLLLTVAQGREGDVREAGEAVELPTAPHLEGAVEHVGDLGAVDRLGGQRFVVVVACRVVVAQLQLARRDDGRQIRWRSGVPAWVGPPASGVECRQQRPAVEEG